MKENQFPLANNGNTNLPIAITNREDGSSIASVKELHEFLDAGSDSNTWFKNQVIRCMLQEGVDFTQISGKSSGGRPSIDYAITIAAAKEISMMNGGEKGKQARQYFIECEKIAKEALKPAFDFTDPSTVLRLAQNWKDEADRREAAEIRVAEQQIKLLLQEPKVEFHDQIMLTEDGILITVIAKEFGWSATRMNKKLTDLKILYKAGETYVLHAKYQNLGYAKTKTHKYVDSEGKLHSAINLVWTQKGRFFIHETIKKLMQNS